MFISFLYKAIAQLHSYDFASQALPFSVCNIESWEESGDEAKP